MEKSLTKQAKLQSHNTKQAQLQLHTNGNGVGPSLKTPFNSLKVAQHAFFPFIPRKVQSQVTPEPFLFLIPYRYPNSFNKIGFPFVEPTSAIRKFSPMEGKVNSDAESRQSVEIDPRLD